MLLSTDHPTEFRTNSTRSCVQKLVTLTSSYHMEYIDISKSLSNIIGMITIRFKKYEMSLFSLPGVQNYETLWEP